MKRFEFTPCPAIWIIYQDGRPAVWCTRKADAEKYRRWGKRKVKHYINIRRYELASSNTCIRRLDFVNTDNHSHGYRICRSQPLRIGSTVLIARDGDKRKMAGTNGVWRDREGRMDDRTVETVYGGCNGSRKSKKSEVGEQRSAIADL